MRNNKGFKKGGQLLLACLFTMFGSSLFAQELTIKGKVVNQQKQPLEYVSVNLLQNDTIMKQVSITDSKGVFLLKASSGAYLLKLSFMAKNLHSQKLELATDLDLGEITVEETKVLEGVTITAKKKLIEQKVDRMVFNVANSVASQGMSGLDAVRNTPMVRVQNESVSIVGKGGVAIMVNDRMLNLSGSELTNYLQSLRSDDIARIEVITTPPSKYEAQGNSGIISIILKKNPNLGWSGNVSTTYQKNIYQGFRNGATVNYQSDKVSTSLKLRQYDYSYKLEGTRNLIGEQNGIYTTETKKNQPKALGLNFSLDYKINEKQNIGFIYDYNNQKYNIDAEGISAYKRLAVTDSVLTTYQTQIWQTPTHTLNAYYDIKLDSLGKKISFVGNYLSNIPDKVNDFNTINGTTNNKDVVRNSSRMNYAIYSGQADVILPYHWANIETGAKYTLFDNESNVGYYDLIGADYIINPNNSNIFNYKEHNYAAYFSIQKDFTKKWSAKAGLRYEYTSLLGESPANINSRVSNSYGKLFPTAYVSFKPNNNHALSLSYSRRINRPDFQSLNPFRWYTNPYIYFTGTPTLRPSYNDNVEFAYTYKNKLTIGLYNQYSTDEVSNIARLENGIYSNVFENSFNQNTTGLRLNYYETFFKRWDMSLSANGTYASTTPTIPEVERLKMYSFSYSIDNTIALNKNKTWFLLLNFWHDLPYLYANIKILEQLSFTPGLKASFFDKKLNASIVLSDAFRTLKSEGYSYNNGYRSEFYNDLDNRRLVLSLSYSFGNTKVKGSIRHIKFDEESRAN